MVKNTELTLIESIISSKQTVMDGGHIYYSSNTPRNAMTSLHALCPEGIDKHYNSTQGGVITSSVGMHGPFDL